MNRVALSRRQFLKLSAVSASGAMLAGRSTRAAGAASGVERGKAPSLLIDLSRCVGCGSCQRACSAANGLTPTTDEAGSLNAHNLTCVEAHTLADGRIRYVKRQCMHCLDAACASACPVSALYQAHEGPIIYRANRCLGCRYCMVSCPFDIPRFEWDDGLTPEIRKCMFCLERQKAGELPACAASCPSGALKFGTREAMLQEAHARIASGGGKYVDHVFGEYEAGGTANLYISDVPFDQLGFRTDVTTRPVPAYTWNVMSKLPAVVGGLAVVLTGASIVTRRRKGSDHDTPPWEAETHDR